MKRFALLTALSLCVACSPIENAKKICERPMVFLRDRASRWHEDALRCQFRQRSDELFRARLRLEALILQTL